MEVTCDCRWSDQADAPFINDFCAVQRAVFHGACNEENFRKKFTHNPYGTSVIAVVYLGNTPVAARALWRNDVAGQVAFQPCNTAVTEACRGKGIFRKMTQLAMAMLPEDALIYNFPNENSRPGYMKMGWTLCSQYRDCLLTSVARYRQVHSQMMDDEYFEWWINKDTHCAKEIAGRYFLVRRHLKRKYIYFVCAEITQKAAGSLRRAGMGLFFYKDTKTTFYNRRQPELWIISRTGCETHIPIWKMDVI